MAIKKYNNCNKKINCIKCNQHGICYAWSNYVKSDVHSRIKAYAHFDERVSLSMPTIQKYILNRDKISSHSFYPFIHFVKTSSHYNGDERKKKERKLNYCSHLDRCVYQRYSFLLNYEYNKLVQKKHINEVAIAYRDILEKNNIDFAQEAFKAIEHYNNCFIIIGDFTNFFDNLDHLYLKVRICELLNVKKLPNDYYAIFKNITKYAYWDWKNLVEISGHKITDRGIRKKVNDQKTIITNETFNKYKNNIQKNTGSKGIPQGSPISAVLSNIYMIEFDKSINAYVSENNGKYFRYSDDFIIILPTIQKDIIIEHRQSIFNYIKNIPGLDLQPEKTNSYLFTNNRITKYNSEVLCSIDYLGFIFDGKYCKIRPKSIAKYYYRMRRKAKTIANLNWKSPYGKNISAKNLYSIYSKNEKSQTFIDYAERASKKLDLKDPETSSLLKNHKQKIKKAIKSRMK